MDFLRHLVNRRGRLYYGTTGDGKENLFSAGSAAGSIRYKPVYQYAAEFSRYFCRFNIFRICTSAAGIILPAGCYDCGIYSGTWIYDDYERCYRVYPRYGIYFRYHIYGMAVFDAGHVFD